jgi:hypothetical protein
MLRALKSRQKEFFELLAELVYEKLFSASFERARIHIKSLSGRIHFVIDASRREHERWMHRSYF